MSERSAIELTSEIIEKLNQNNNETYVMDFWAPWCGPCMVFKPIFEEAAKEINFPMYTVNIDEHRDFSMSYGIRSIPTIIMMHNGEQYKHVGSIHSVDELVQWINSNLK